MCKLAEVLAEHGEGDREITTQRVAWLDSPDDLVPRTAQVRFEDIELPGRFRVVIDPQKQIDELYEGNNVVMIE